MFAQSIRASRQALVRVARQQPALVARRTFIVPTAVRQADLVQELYLRELKAYKPTPVKPTDAEGHVQTFAIPKAPASPEEADIANELKDYETQQVELEGSSTEDGAAPVEEDWFEEEVEEAPAAHH
ncbi:mitochondrial F1F0 ATP synthase-like protein subunit Atp14 [Dendryphion nanum]|uniref:Mitochondrial F1F0 ATP synthase-like protein subunit Atp14 n=1 Tax=Dendryphion nanum TaxID=256645 RepID=A0A9P9ELX1_9PLEO|nr:mitochondrial F1F0 ATP synthase-like protein subunit Atp14 [Dendryphion nanum]